MFGRFLAKKATGLFAIFVNLQFHWALGHQLLDQDHTSIKFMRLMMATLVNIVVFYIFLILFCFFFIFLVKSQTLDQFIKPKKTMEETLVKMIADNGFTLNQIVNCEFLKESFLNNNWQMPSSATTLKNMVLAESEKQIAKMKETISSLQQNGETFSAIIDEWTSIAGSRFMSVSVKSATKSFNLGMARIYGSANADNLKQVLLDRLGMFGIQKIVALTCDGASVMKSLIKKLDCVGQLCINHGAHLAVKDTFGLCENVADDDDLDEHSDNEYIDEYIHENYCDVIKKMRKIIGLFNHSALLQEKLAEKQKEDNVEQLKLVTPITIRWNSLQLACARFIKVYPQLKNAINEENLTRSSVFFTFFKFYFINFNINL